MHTPYSTYECFVQLPSRTQHATNAGPLTSDVPVELAADIGLSGGFIPPGIPKFS